MGIQYSQFDHGIRLIRLSGRLDIYGTKTIEPQLALHTNGNQLLIILDMSEVEFLASIGIRMLVMAAKSVIAHGGKIVILNPISNVKEVLELTGILQAVPVYSDLDEAVKQLQM